MGGFSKAGLCLVSACACAAPGPVYKNLTTYSLQNAAPLRYKRVSRSP